MTTDDTLDFAHVGPETLAGRFLRLFWQPIARSADLEKGRPVRVPFANEHFTLYRGESGAVVLLDDRCPHRHCPLSLGHTEGGALINWTTRLDPAAAARIAGLSLPRDAPDGIVAGPPGASGITGLILGGCDAAVPDDIHALWLRRVTRAVADSSMWRRAIASMRATRARCASR